MEETAALESMVQQVEKTLKATTVCILLDVGRDTVLAWSYLSLFLSFPINKPLAHRGCVPYCRHAPSRQSKKWARFELNLKPMKVAPW